MRSDLRRYGDTTVMPFDESNLSPFSDLLFRLGIGDELANYMFRLDYADAYTPYTDDEINQIVRHLFVINFKKYDKLGDIYTASYNPINNYNMTEQFEDTRTPDLAATTTTTASASSTSKIQKTQRTTDTPDNYQQTSVRSVNPYDNSGMRSESQNIVTDSGKRTTTVSYSGDPDSATSTTSSSTTATNTGTETTIHSGSRSGNIGVTTTQQMLESELELAQKMDLFKIIELDVAAKIFIGVW